MAELDPPGSIIGSPAYMAPEQVEGLHEQIDARTDVFALGATLYQILTGRPPYHGANYYQLLNRVLLCDYQPPKEVVGEGVLPPGLTRIAIKAMAPRTRGPLPVSVGDAAAISSFSCAAHGTCRPRSSPLDRRSSPEGEEASAAYIVTEGRCLVSKAIGDYKNEMRELGPGDVFGEMAIFSSRPRSATVEALEDVTVMVVKREMLSSGLELNSWMGRFVKTMADRFLEIDERLRMIESGQPQSRLRQGRRAPFLAPIASRQAPSRGEERRPDPRGLCGGVFERGPLEGRASSAHTARRGPGGAVNREAGWHLARPSFHRGEAGNLRFVERTIVETHFVQDPGEVTRISQDPIPDRRS